MTSRSFKGCPPFLRFIVLIYMTFSVQLSWSAAPLLLNESDTHLNLLPYLEYFVEADKSVTIQKILKGSPEWEAIDTAKENANFGYTKEAYWFHFSILNVEPTEQKATIEIGYPVLDRIDIYSISASQSLEHIAMGDKLRFDERPISHRNFIFPLSIKKDEIKQYYIRVETSSSLQLPITLWREKTLLKNTQAEMLGLGVYFGTMLVMILYNLFVFFSVRESNYLYYVLYVSCISLFFASLNGISYQYIWPNSTWWNDQSLVFFLSGVVLFAALFTIRFLRIRDTFPRFRHFGTFVVIVSMIVIVISLFIPYSIMIKLILGWAVIGIGTAIFAGIYRWILGDSSAKYYCISWFTLLIGGVILALNKWDIIPRNILTENATQFGSALEVILLSFALADRLNVEKRRRFEAQIHALENERVARLAQAEALQQEKKARVAQEQALRHEQEARKAQAAALDIQKQATETLENRVKERTQDLEVANQRLEELTYTDGLTSIKNRRFLNRSLEREFARARREKTPLAILLIDIDHFKQFNDTYGHLSGDDCLRELALAINSCSQRENDVVARYGGEEFCVLLPNTDEIGAAKIAEEILEAIRQVQVQTSTGMVAITASIGITSCIPERKHSIEQFVNTADSALYESKNNGRNQARLRFPDFDSEQKRNET